MNRVNFFPLYKMLSWLNPSSSKPSPTEIVFDQPIHWTVLRKNYPSLQRIDKVLVLVDTITSEFETYISRFPFAILVFREYNIRQLKQLKVLRGKFSFVFILGEWYGTFVTLDELRLLRRGLLYDPTKGRSQPTSEQFLKNLFTDLVGLGMSHIDIYLEGQSVFSFTELGPTKITVSAATYRGPNGIMYPKSSDNPYNYELFKISPEYKRYCKEFIRRMNTTCNIDLIDKYYLAVRTVNIGFTTRLLWDMDLRESNYRVPFQLYPPLTNYFPDIPGKNESNATLHPITEVNARCINSNLDPIEIASWVYDLWRSKVVIGVRERNPSH